mgnify:CR=1 FL=1
MALNVRRLNAVAQEHDPSSHAEVRAIRAGATGLKFFPAEILGPKGIKAIKAVLPKDLPLYAVGGASPENFGEFFDAGCIGFGLGSYIFKPGMSPADIGARARAAVASATSTLIPN